MSKAPRIVLSVFGCFLVLIIILNVEVGLWSHHEEYNQKVDLIGFATLSCTEADIFQDLDNSGQSPCLHPLGNYALSDLLIGGLGAIFAFIGVSSILNLRLSSRGQLRRRSWALMIGGAIVAIFGSISLLGITNGDVEWASIFGIPSFLVELLLIIGGAYLFRRGSSSHSEIISQSSTNRVRYRGRMELDGSDMSVGQMRRILGL
ncbi:MAG: hypothetical protein QGH13_04895, partial [Candidatus Thalassarchaeaceae archaeon]|nr:hypothetical protein [Candidatus Thalassarchaeaceae archaeon]